MCAAQVLQLDAGECVTFAKLTTFVTQVDTIILVDFVKVCGATATIQPPHTLTSHP